MSMEHVVIVGNGVAGITAARTIRQLSGRRITVVSGESRHFYSRPALMYIFMGHMTYESTKPYEDWFWEKNRIELKQAYVEKIDSAGKMVLFRDGSPPLRYDTLLLATGSQSSFFGWPGQDLDGVQGFYGLPDLEAMERNTRRARRAVVVGGGLIGVEVAEMLLSRGIHVTYLVREPAFATHFLPREEAEMVSGHVREHGVDLRHETELKELLGDSGGRVRAVITSKGEEISCDFVALAVGVKPNVDLARTSGIETNRGILVDDRLATNAAGIFAAGDCVELRTPRPGRRAIEPVWYTGRMMGEVAGRNICGESASYDPGIWFNSAKFFGIEYQVYGEIRPQLPETHETLFWMRGDRRKSIRIDYEKQGGKVIGFNLMGVRYRHEVCESWIAAGTSIREVLADLGAANFDPEFFRQYESDMIEVYNRTHPESPVILRRRKSLWSALQVLASRKP